MSESCKTLGHFCCEYIDFEESRRGIKRGK